jgi:hypothetical protein
MMSDVSILVNPEIVTLTAQQWIIVTRTLERCHHDCGERAGHQGSLPDKLGILLQLACILTSRSLKQSILYEFACQAFHPSAITPQYTIVGFTLGL